VAAAAVRKGLADRELTISMPGGDLEIVVADDWSIRMTGPAVEVYSGTFSEHFIRALEAGP
jgi:diaminopimelate epimerase